MSIRRVILLVCTVGCLLGCLFGLTACAGPSDGTGSLEGTDAFVRRQLDRRGL